MPKVSIIIPVYNASRYLRECLDSILLGDLKEIEVIAVDDGSTDDSLNILNQYREEHGIIVLSQINSGPAKARNAGLNVATGEYIGFVDADDWVEPTMFSEMYLTAKQENADIVFCNVMRNQDTRMRKYLESGVYDKAEIRNIIYPRLISNLDETRGKATIRGCVWLRIFRRELLVKNQIRFDERLIYNEDGLFCIEATLACKRYVYLGDSYLYHNRYVENSLTKRYIDNLWSRQHPMIVRLKSAVGDSGYDFSSQISKKAMEIAIYCIENICKPDNRQSYSEKKETIRTIIKSDDIRNGVKNIPLGRLKRINKLYWLSILLCSPMLAVAAARHRMKRNGSM